jgi:hypothetical protein
MKVLITLPTHDSGVKCISEWNYKYVVPLAEKRSSKCDLIRNRNVNRSTIEYKINKENHDLLIFNGHGSFLGDSICGHNDEEIVKFGENHNILDAKIVHSFTCCSGKILGRNCNSDAFIGYDNAFSFWMHRSTTTRPLDDILSRPSIESALVAPIKLLKGAKASEAYRKSQERYQKYIDEYLWKGDQYTKEERDMILPFLMSNKRAQKLYGNENASV